MILMQLSSDATPSPCAVGEPAFRELIAARRGAIEADMAAGADLGFLLGQEAGGHYLVIFERAADCAWTPVFEGRSVHSTPQAGQPLDAATARLEAVPAPSREQGSEQGATRALEAFQAAVRDEGLAPGLRTYARNDGFRLLLQGAVPMDLSGVDRHLKTGSHRGSWQEARRIASRDAVLLFTRGTFMPAGDTQGAAYAGLWQYDPKVCNWGLRTLFIG
jgi:hypothetical protein